MHYPRMFAVALTLVAAPTLAGQTAQSGPRDPVAIAMAERANEAPAIDGQANGVWTSAPKVSEFRQFEPRVDADPTFRTEFQVAYDDRNLYVYVRAYDASPDSIMHALTRRGVRGPSDQIGVIIDSYNDRRTGFEFIVNPDGVKRDFAISNDGWRDGSWRGVWDVATRVDEHGWVAEFRIPFSQLRYADAEAHTFGFGIWRDVERYRERVSWPAYDPNRQGLISQLGRLDGIEAIGSARPLEVTPYTATKNFSRATGNGGFERAQDVSIGADIKYGLTPNITLDVTVNPDFGQVEADPAQVNLTAFETFFSERRPFFMEGTGLYRFELNCYIVVDCSTNEGLFYSRRIGRAPTLQGTYGDARTPGATPIAAAAKLTGRTRGGLSFGVLDAVTQQVDGREGSVVEPRTNYVVLRARQDLRGGEADVSWITTAVNRSLDEWTRPVLHSSAYVSGLSFRNRLGDGDYELAGSLTGSRVAGSPEALVRTQRSAVHYYQRPDGGLVLDSMRTSLAGYGAQLKFGKYGGGITRFESSLIRQSAGFEVNDLGFLRRADTQDWSTWASLVFREPRWIYRWARANVNHWQTWNTSGQRLEQAWNLNGHMGLKNNWSLHAGGTVGGLGSSVCDRCTRGGPAVRQSRGFYPWFGVNGDSRLTVVPSLWVNLAYRDEGRGRRSSISPDVSVRFSTRFEASFGGRVLNERNNTQWYGNFADDDGATHYAFAHLDQREVSLTTRLNYTATPNLTFEFYGQPFVSRGTYSDIRELSATPDARAYDDRFQPFALPEGSDVAYKSTQLRSNAVIRWEYRPGSTMFLVWTHGRGAWTNEDARQSLGRDYRDLLGLRPDNTFMLKLAHWFNR